MTDGGFESPIPIWGVEGERWIESVSARTATRTRLEISHRILEKWLKGATCPGILRIYNMKFCMKFCSAKFQQKVKLQKKLDEHTERSI
jgi:hypothetical protein